MKKLIIAIGVLSAFMLGYGAMGAAYGASQGYGRAEWHGYFHNALDSAGDNVFPSSYAGNEAFPTGTNTAAKFISFIKNTQLDVDNNGSGSPREAVGAAFIIQTMISTQASPFRSNPPTTAQITEWQNRVNYSASTGRITWRQNYAFAINSYWQGGNSGSTLDDAFYDNSDSAESILFRTAPGGAVVYALKLECANPVGNLKAIPNDSTWNTSGTVELDNDSPSPGQTIHFDYFVRNNGPNTTDKSIWSLAGGSGHASVNNGTMTSGEEIHFDQQDILILPGTPAGTQICRHTTVQPRSFSDSGSFVSDDVCATVVADFSLQPVITVLVNGSPPVAGSAIEQGDLLEFRYAIVNGGPGASSTASCTINAKNDIPGYHTAPTPSESTVGWTVFNGAGCPRTFPTAPPSTDISIGDGVSVDPSKANKSICRVLTVNPSSATVGAKSVEACVQVSTHPYLRVYGGDVSAGNGQPPTCTSANSGVISWNKETPTFSGAGAQYAVMAIGQINDFASTLGSAAGATPPSSLSFANTTASGANIFGGSFGSLPCIADYYARSAQMTTSALPSTNLSALSGNNAYTATGPITLGGNINPNQRTVLFVNGDVLITSNISFPGSWSTATMPMFQLVVRGNIFVSQSVTQLDGVYIAQPTNPAATNGIIYTCATTALPAASVPTSDSTLYSKCKNKLTINGSFVAKQVQFLRTPGTLSQSSAGEASTSANIAEVFNYSPASWMAQPPAPAGTAGEYDSITSLPPIL